MQGTTLSELTDTFRSAEFLPTLPETALRVVEIIDRPDPCPRQVQDAVAHDAQLAANLIRLASSAAYYSLGKAPMTLGSAILRLGLAHVRMLTMTFSIRSALWRSTPSEGFDPRRFADHSTFIAEASANLVRREAFLRGAPTPPEAFAVGLLHDLPACLLAHVAPPIFDQCWYRARTERSSFDRGFQAEFGESPSVLAEAAARAWSLPQLDAGWPDWLESAHDLATLSGATWEEWPIESRALVEERTRIRFGEEPAEALRALFAA